MDGYENLEAELSGMARAMQRGPARAAGKIAALLEASAKADHRWGNPYSPGYKPTGVLAESIHGLVENVNADGATAVLGAFAEYAAALELGFGGKYAWMMKAVDAKREDIAKIVREELGRGG